MQDFNEYTKSKKPTNTPKSQNKTGLYIIIGFVAFVFIFTTVYNLYNDNVKPNNELKLSQVITDARDGKIESIEECNEQAKVKYKTGDNKVVLLPNGTSIVNQAYSKYGYDLDPKLVSGGSCKDNLSTNKVLEFVFQGTMLLLMGFIAWKIITNLNESGSKIFGFGESKARFSIGKKQDVSLKDVAGVDEASEELNEIVMFLKEPQRFRKMGARIPKGILMIGAPGTGKTLLARAIAGEAAVPFFSTSGSEFEEMLVGAGASRVRDLFTKAKKVAPSLIFIDEIDAVGKRRGTTVNSSSTEQTLNQILVEMDGFDRTQNVIVIAATNRPDVLDPALLRPGRFDRKITLDLPDQDGRLAILKIHSDDKPLGEDVNLEKIAKRTIGFSGADLENVMNEAAISAAKKDKKVINEEDVEEATLKVVMGTARKRRRTEKELDTVAYHEAGHALVSKFAPESDPVHKITIVSRGMSGGMTMQLPTDDNTLISRTKMLSEIKVLMGGQIAEKIFIGDITSGASNDISRATDIARKMVTKYGMSTAMGPLEYGVDATIESFTPVLNYSQLTSEQIDNEVRKIIGECYKDAESIILQHKEQMNKLKVLLREKEVVNSEDFELIFS